MASCVALPGRAQLRGSSVGTRTALYQDDDRTTIVTSTLAVRGAVTDDVTLNARYLLDAISTASVDVVTAATGRWTEERYEVEAGAGYYDGTLDVSAGYIFSHEHDWDSHTVNAGVAHDFLGHDLTASLGGTFVDNTVGRKDDNVFERSLTVVGGSASLTGVASPEQIWALTYSLSHLRGYQASPYRFPRFVDETSPDQQFSPNGELHPERRLRHAVVLRHNWHLFRDTALRSHLRGYRDDWGVASVTLGTEHVVGWGEWETAIFLRGYAQRHADFYRDVYDGQRRYMTADRELSTFYDVFGGGRLVRIWNAIGPVDELRVELKVTGFLFHFTEFERLPNRRGLVAELAAEARF